MTRLKARTQNFQFFQVYDHDWGFRDDFMGEGRVPLSEMSLDKLTEQVITLEDTNTTEYLGQIVLGVRLVPKATVDGSVLDNSSVGSLVKATGLTLTASMNSHQSGTSGRVAKKN